MRCRKARSCLSAYYKGELAEAQHREVTDHLETCPDCRREAVSCRELVNTIRKLPRAAVSDGFNSRLLNRIANERHHETRTRAHMPKRVPVIGMNRLAPVLATFCLVLAFVFSGGIDKLIGPNSETIMLADNNADPVFPGNDYRTAQPATSHTISQHASRHWQFDKQVARANRMKGYVNQLASSSNFGNYSYNRTNRFMIPMVPIWHMDTSGHRGLMIQIPIGNFPPRGNAVQEVQQDH